MPGWGIIILYVCYLRWRLKMRTEYIPRALREVWEWKDSIYREVKHLPRKQALQKIIENAEIAARELGFGVSGPGKKPLAVREAPAGYTAEKSRHRKHFKHGQNNALK